MRSLVSSVAAITSIPLLYIEGCSSWRRARCSSLVLTAAPKVDAYWSLFQTVQRARKNPFAGSFEDAVDELSQLLGDAVRQRLVADVPLGAFLSGGYDSSTVVALMQAHSGRRVRTFSIGFREADYDEVDVCRRRGAASRHRPHRADRNGAGGSGSHPPLAQIYDEPFADSSQIPTFLVSQLARRQVTVALSGDGGDEVFAGYNRYAQGERIRRRIGALPVGVRRAVAAGMRRARPETWDMLSQIVPERARPRYLGDKIHKLSDVITESDEGAYLKLTSPWPDPEGVVIDAGEIAWPKPDPRLVENLPLSVERMQYLDTISYLPGDILTKLDRASMAVSLEARTPMLDHRVVEFAWSLPLEHKVRDGQGKWIMRQVLYRHVPPALIERAKSGFAIPLGDWLRGPLRDWAEDLLDASRLRATGIFNPDPIRRRWTEHLAGRRNWQHALWSVLMFEAWLHKHAR